MYSHIESTMTSEHVEVEREVTKLDESRNVYKNSTQKYYTAIKGFLTNSEHAPPELKRFVSENEDFESFVEKYKTEKGFNKDTKILIIGVTQVGKTTLIEQIYVNKIPRNESGGLDSDTVVIKEYCIENNGANIIFVDTPGFFDTDPLKREKNLEQILEYIQKNHESIGAIWLCQKKGNPCIYENELKRIFNLNIPDSDEIFDMDYWKRLSIKITHANDKPHKCYYNEAFGNDSDLKDLDLVERNKYLKENPVKMEKMKKDAWKCEKGKIETNYKNKLRDILKTVYGKEFPYDIPTSYLENGFDDFEAEINDARDVLLADGTTWSCEQHMKDIMKQYIDNGMFSECIVFNMSAMCPDRKKVITKCRNIHSNRGNNISNSSERIIDKTTSSTVTEYTNECSVSEKEYKAKTKRTTDVVIETAKESGGCISSDSEIIVKRGLTTMTIQAKNLEIGDKVFIGNKSKKNTLSWFFVPNDLIKYEINSTEYFSTIIGFGHKDLYSSTKYIKIDSENGSTVFLTPNHFIPTFSNYGEEINCDNISRICCDMVKAENLKIGDTIMTATLQMNRKHTSYSKITQISTIYKEGKICPITEDGSIVSNGIIISCYVDFRNNLPQNIKESYGFNCNTNRAVILTHAIIGKIIYGRRAFLKKYNYKNLRIHGLDDNGIPHWVMWAKRKFNIDVF